MQMIKIMLDYLITSVNIKRTCNMIKKVCCFNRAQMNLKTVENFIVVKHYNRKTDCTKKSYNVTTITKHVMLNH